MKISNRNAKKILDYLLAKCKKDYISVVNRHDKPYDSRHDNVYEIFLVDRDVDIRYRNYCPLYFYDNNYGALKLFINDKEYFDKHRHQCILEKMLEISKKHDIVFMPEYSNTVFLPKGSTFEQLLIESDLAIPNE